MTDERTTVHSRTYPHSSSLYSVQFRKSSRNLKDPGSSLPPPPPPPPFEHAGDIFLPRLSPEPPPDTLFHSAISSPFRVSSLFITPLALLARPLSFLPFFLLSSSFLLPLISSTFFRIFPTHLSRPLRKLLLKRIRRKFRSPSLVPS